MGITPWVRHTPERAMNRKLRQAGFAARGLDDAAICQVAADDSDGYITEETVEVLAVAHRERGWKRLVDLLVKAGRWEPTEGGWIVHDYEEFNFTKAYWEADRRKKKQAGALGGRAKALADAKANAKPNGTAHAKPSATAHGEANAVAASLRFVDPPLVPPNTHAGNGHHQTDQDHTQTENQDPPALTPQAQKLVDRWLSIIAKPNPLARADARRWIPHLLDTLSADTLDELIGKAGEVTPPPQRITYLAASARDFARTNLPGTTITDPPSLARR